MQTQESFTLFVAQKPDQATVYRIYPESAQK
jgi:hypothetical protein